MPIKYHLDVYTHSNVITAAALQFHQVDTLGNESFSVVLCSLFQIRFYQTWPDMLLAVDYSNGYIREFCLGINL